MHFLMPPGLKLADPDYKAVAFNPWTTTAPNVPIIFE